ncbi:MAG: UDP diphosphate synthase, partial [Salinirussus sp.]
MGLYEAYLAARIRLSDATLPETVAVVITETDLLEADAYTTLEEFFECAVEYGAQQVLVYVSVIDEAAIPTLRTDLAAIEAPRPVAVRSAGDDERAAAPIQVSI